MVSDKPPRRSRPGKTPVTIDLAADAAPPVAEPVRSTDTDAVTDLRLGEPDTPPAQSAPDDTGATATESTASESPSEATNASADRTPDDTAPADTAGVTSPFATPTDGPATDIDRGNGSSEPPSPPTDAPPKSESAEPEPAPRPAAAAPKGTSGSALMASGILGGLVALLLAGSMQYAGYLPGLNNRPAASTSAELDELRQQVAELRNAPAAPNTDLAARIEALEASAGNAPASDELQQRLTALQSEIDALKSATDSTAAGTTQLTDRLAALETEVNQPGPEQAVARALAAAALKAATERGGSFAAELQTFGAVAPDDPAVEGLKAYAEQGVPTKADLTRRLPNATNAILDALQKPDENQGIAARLMSSALSVVKVRPVGDVQGDTPEAVVARFEERVKTGDLKAAVSEWNALPDTAKQASADFKQALDARIEVEDLMNGTLTRAMTSAGSNG
jgi:hypothetical protein